ncbi:CaiB/BaiF CoA transferase family protein [Oceanobacillus sp. CF4.6]|uniref:CaiB/BaiF CoA transferase family protein n=1 Tax=Oceanobacillus sp. CF4.6 TaxID=3373080 RepID=UPI003EE78815
MQPLEGIKILDLTRTLAGPFCTMLLGDVGADVIKVEQPGTGDEARNFTPPEWDGESCYYLSSNRNKKSITINLKSQRGKDIIYKLVEEADVLVENFKTGSLDKMGYGYDDLKKINPGLIYCSISGFGRTGPEKYRAGYDLLLQGFGGLMSITGEPDRTPVKAGMSIVDLTTGMFAAYGIQSALFAKQKTGKGQLLDVSLLDGQVMLLNHMATGYLATGKPAGKMGSAHPTLVPYQAFETKDANIIMAVGNDRQWENCCITMDWMDLLEDGRFKTNQKRVENRGELVPILKSRLVLMESKEVFEKTEKVGVPCGPIHTIDQVINHSQVIEREMIINVEHPHIKNLRMPGFPVKFSETPGEVRQYPPLLGEHTGEILSELGYTESEIEEMKAEKAI